MKTLHKLFFETKMTWQRVSLFAIAAAVLTAAVLIIPFTANSSLGNLGVSMECWILFALIIIMNCEKPLEAGVKTFVFFLISQPLIYLLQVPFYSQGWEIFRYYPRWFIWTLLCFPGGIIAWYVKKDNVLSALILSVATGLLGFECIYYASQCVRVFPKHLLTVIFIAVLAAVLIFVLLKNKRNRIITGSITLLAALAACFLCFSGTAPNINIDYNLDAAHAWEITSQDGYVGKVWIDSQTENVLQIDANQYGTENVTVTNEAGETVDLVITFDRAGGLSVAEK